MVSIPPQALAWALLSNLMFGSSNFLISYCNSQPGGDAWATVGQIWFTCGLIGLGLAVYCWYTMGTIFFTERDVELKQRTKNQPLLPNGPIIKKMKGSSLSLAAKMITVLGSFFVVLTLIFCQRAFATDPAATGPLMSVLSADIMVVGTFCHFVYGERLAKAQFGGIGLILAGLAVMVLGDGGGKIMGFVYAFLAMLSLAGSLICVRYTCIEGQASISRLAGRMFTLLFFGAAALVYAWSTGAFNVDESADLMALYFWPNVSGLCQFVGVAALNVALQYPCTAAVNVIVDSNAVLGLVLSYFVLGAVPSTAKLIGMAMICTAVVTIVLNKAPKKASAQVFNIPEAKKPLLRRSDSIASIETQASFSSQHSFMSQTTREIETV